MKLLIVILTTVLASFCQAQNVSDLDSYSIDTLHLTMLTAKKVIVFKYSNLTYYVDYKDYRTAIKSYKKDYLYQRSYKDEFLNNRKKEVDTLLKETKRQFKKHDTIYLTQSDIMRFGTHLTEKFIATQIDKTHCLVFDDRNLPVTKIIRVTGGYVRGFKDGWGGVRYYLPRQDKFFIEITTVMS